MGFIGSNVRWGCADGMIDRTSGAGYAACLATKDDIISFEKEAGGLCLFY